MSHSAPHAPPTTHTLLQALRDVLGDDAVTTGSALLEHRFADWSGIPAQTPLALLRPRTTEQVQSLMRICHHYRQPVVVQGGLSGLAGAACTRENDIALSVERMNAIEDIDLVSGTLTVQAGATLQAIQEAAAQHGMLFPLDLGARGSCTIGGNLACNAGGTRVIQYGMAREQVLDLEAVLPDGRLIGGQRKMLKNNTGLDLKQLLIGSEGLLGIITRATLRLRPAPSATATAWCGLPNYSAVTTLLHKAQKKLPQGVCTFEVIWPSYYHYVLSQLPDLRPPLQGSHPYHVLLESVGSTPALQTDFENFLAHCLEDGIVEDAAIALSTADAQALWKIREAPAEFPRLMPRLLGFDISFAIRDIDRATHACSHALRSRWPHCTLLEYGHLGDGNLHLIVDIPDASDTALQEAERIIYDVVAHYQGSVSAEHGIGLKKRAVLPHSRSHTELDLMLSIKRAIDPYNLLNPGKVFPDAWQHALNSIQG